MIRQYINLQTYLDDTLELLIENPVKHNIVLGILLGVKDRNKLLENVLLVNVFSGDKLVLSLIKNRPYLLIYGENYTSENLHELIEFLRNLNIDIEGVIGEKAISIAFAQMYANEFSTSRTLTIQKLVKLKSLVLSQGKMSVCLENDIEVVADWIYRFYVECNLPHIMAKEQILQDTKRRIELGQIYKWEQNQQMMSICAEVVSTDYFSKISLVYTPYEYRGKGFARSCVWSLCQSILDRQQNNICLFTDKSNPTSNKIYSEIGFEIISEDYEIKFESSK